MEINATFIFIAISFLVFIYILDKVLWRPIESVKYARFVEVDLEERSAQIQQKKAAELMQTIQDKLSKLHTKHQDELSTVTKKLHDKFQLELNTETQNLDKYLSGITHNLDEEQQKINSQINLYAEPVAKEIINKIVTD